MTLHKCRTPLKKNQVEINRFQGYHETLSGFYLLGSADFRLQERRREMGPRLERASLVTVASRERSWSPDLIKRRNTPRRPCKTHREGEMWREFKGSAVIRHGGGQEQPLKRFPLRTARPKGCRRVRFSVYVKELFKRIVNQVRWEIWKRNIIWRS